MAEFEGTPTFRMYVVMVKLEETNKGEDKEMFQVVRIHGQNQILKETNNQAGAGGQLIWF